MIYNCWLTKSDVFTLHFQTETLLYWLRDSKLEVRDFAVKTERLKVNKLFFFYGFGLYLQVHMA